MREMCSYLEFFWFAFFHIRTEYGDLNSKYGYFSAVDAIDDLFSVC